MPYNNYSGRSSGRHFSPKRGGGSGSSRRAPARNNKKYIDPSRFVKVATAQEEAVYEPQNRFSDFALNETLQQNLSGKGYVLPSPIQDQTIPAALEGKDIIGIASTGTGKTAAFALPILHKLMGNPKARAIVVAPTRELAEQIEQEFRSLGKRSGLFGALVIGGTNMGGQLRDLRSNPQIVIGTPGRIQDHIRRGSLDLSNFSIAVLDEVDRMLDMGFINDVTSIVNSTSQNRQSLFFSATMDSRVRSLINAFTSEPFVVSIKASSSSDSVHQNVVRYQAKEDKLEKLHDLLLRADVSKVIVFDETQRNVERLDQELQSRGFSAASIHGGKSQGQRKRALDSFKKNQISILVATDVAARGIDVADISHVINFNIPNDYEDYVHRIGRAGRAGKIGHALTFIQN